MKKLLKNKNLVILITSIALCLIISTVYCLFVMPKPISGQKNITLKIEYANDLCQYQLQTDSQTVLQLLQEYNQICNLRLVTEEGQYGAFITSLNGVAQDEINGYYYTYTVNDQYSSGISVQTIKDGDVIHFKYMHVDYDENWNVIDQKIGGQVINEFASYKRVAIILFSIAGVILVAGVSYFIVSKIKKGRE